MWKQYFKLIKLQPGRVVTNLCGEIDFSSDNIPVETLLKLYTNKFPYLEITELGKTKFFGTIPEITTAASVVPQLPRKRKSSV